MSMPSFDVVSELDLQEVRNAVDQAQREVATRFDFKDTGSAIELGDGEIRLRSASEDRLRALTQVLEEKLARAKEAVEKEARKAAARDEEASKILGAAPATTTNSTPQIPPAPTVIKPEFADDAPDVAARKSRLSD